MPTIDTLSPSQCPRWLHAAVIRALAFVIAGAIGSVASLVAGATPAYAGAARFSFAVIANTMHRPADEAATQRLIEAISRERDVSFIVYAGNLKGPREACRDELYERRHALLETARPALFFIPGQHDWVDCGTAEAGGFDPVERLDLLRQTLFADTTSMGQNPLALTRESEVSRFRPFRENVRWQAGDVVFVGLNAPGPNNHYLTAGGRNGEFEDRAVANAFWLEHAGEYAKRRDARAVVVFIQGDPDPERYERPERFAWLRFAHTPRRDGFLEFKRSLVKLAQIFHGPVLVIHCDDERTSGGFVIDQPLRNDKGMLVTNLTRVALAPHDRLNQWIQIEVEPGRKPPFRVSVRNVPKQMPMPATQPALPREEPAASMPAAPMPGPASELPPLLPTPGEPQVDSQPHMPANQGGGEYGPAISAPPAPAIAPRVPGAAPGLSVPGGEPASSVQSGP
ncbi:conserved exported hypothetical protein [Paraburkholderia ribeironis]|uniref:Transmembrane protein n=1 Tax=Paraburkholderia ribeironis TaxID=1247936 RepID=A0A1N7RSX2_9BURK|nr:hypothetical protein [Paraburkholderia ribeironis]SIT37772.1 conserved exported hypothetical protein [Paraburkholderia ribeironis]